MAPSMDHEDGLNDTAGMDDLTGRIITRAVNHEGIRSFILNQSVQLAMRMTISAMDWCSLEQFYELGDIVWTEGIKRLLKVMKLVYVDEVVTRITCQGLITALLGLITTEDQEFEDVLLVSETDTRYYGQTAKLGLRQESRMTTARERLPRKLNERFAV
jgi:hypothetical protein